MREIRFRGWDKKYKIMRPVIAYSRPYKHIPITTKAGYPSYRSEVGNKYFGDLVLQKQEKKVISLCNTQG